MDQIRSSYFLEFVMNFLQQSIYNALASVIVSLLLLINPSHSATQQTTPETLSVVYHINQGLDQAKSALAYIVNQLEEESNTHIEVVAHASGIYFLIADATTPQGQAFSPLIDTLAKKGVIFKVCEKTLRTLNIPPSKLNPHVVLTPSGTAEITKLQHEGFAYIKP
jgi:intracellular sulfur oxidation DsrE/DsrF family protein